MRKVKEFLAACGRSDAMRAIYFTLNLSHRSIFNEALDEIRHKLALCAQPPKALETNLGALHAEELATTVGPLAKAFLDHGHYRKHDGDGSQTSSHGAYVQLLDMVTDFAEKNETLDFDARRALVTPFETTLPDAVVGIIMDQKAGLFLRVATSSLNRCHSLKGQLEEGIRRGVKGALSKNNHQAAGLFVIAMARYKITAVKIFREALDPSDVVSISRALFKANLGGELIEFLDVMAVDSSKLQAFTPEWVGLIGNTLYTRHGAGELRKFYVLFADRPEKTAHIHPEFLSQARQLTVMPLAESLPPRTVTLPMFPSISGEGTQAHTSLRF